MLIRLRMAFNFDFAALAKAAPGLEGRLAPALILGKGYFGDLIGEDVAEGFVD